jgi:hypothetical protein
MKPPLSPMSAGTLCRSEARCKGLVPASTLTARTRFVTVRGTFDRVSARGDLVACIEARHSVSFGSHPLVRGLPARDSWCQPPGHWRSRDGAERFGLTNADLPPRDSPPPSSASVPHFGSGPATLDPTQSRPKAGRRADRASIPPFSPRRELGSYEGSRAPPFVFTNACFRATVWVGPELTLSRG